MNIDGKIASVEVEAVITTTMHFSDWKIKGSDGRMWVMGHVDVSEYESATGEDWPSTVTYHGYPLNKDGSSDKRVTGYARFYPISYEYPDIDDKMIQIAGRHR